MQATNNIQTILFEMRSHTDYLNGYFTNGKGQISEAIIEDDFHIERLKIFRLGQLLETLENDLNSGSINFSQIQKDCKKATELLSLLMEAETRKGSHKDFLSVQNCNDLATINSTKISNEK